LDWEDASGTWRGHSGGPVVDSSTAALVGVLIEGAEEGRFDRFLPLDVIRQVWTDMPRPWLTAGIDAGDHFRRGASGQRIRARGGDLFRGRDLALRVIREWLTSVGPLGRPLVVTGQPGAGKSAVVARAALSLEAEHVGPALAYHARASTHNQFLSALAQLIGLSTDNSVDSLVDAITNATVANPWIVIVDALDEATDRKEIARTLRDLAALPEMRVTVATRPLSAGSRYGPGQLLPTLGVTASTSPNLVDLDTDQYFDIADLRAFAAALLAQQGAKNPGPPGCAWTAYRSEPRLCDRMAHVIAARSKRNYLVTALAAVPLSEKDTATDPDASGFSATSIPSELGEALARYLDVLPDVQRAQTEALLTALAYARGEGIDDSLWLKFAAALGYEDRQIDLDLLHTSVAADLVQTVSTESGLANRLFHQALVDELVAKRGVRRTADEHALLQTLLPGVGGWPNASPYALAYAAAHAASALADDLSDLVNDVQFIMVADVFRLLPFLTPPDRFGEMGAVVRRAGGRASSLGGERRARLLALTAAHLGMTDTGSRFAETHVNAFMPVWAHTLGGVHQEFSPESGEINSVALGHVEGRDVIVVGSTQGTLIWDAVSGSPLYEPLVGHVAALGRVGDRDIIVSGSYDGTLRIWDAGTGSPLADPLVGHTRRVNAVALGYVNDRDIVVSGSYDRTLRMWDARTGSPLAGPLVGHTDSVEAVVLGRIDDHDVIVSASEDATVRIWDARTGTPLGEPLAIGNELDHVNSLALGRIGDHEIIVTGGWDGRLPALSFGAAVSPRSRPNAAVVRIWDAATRQQLGEPLSGYVDRVYSLAIGHVADRMVLVSGSDSIRIWDFLSREPLGEPLVGHSDWVTAVAVGRIGDRDVVASGSMDKTVRIWDLAKYEFLDKPLIGHSAPVNALAIGVIADRNVIVSGSDDRTVRVWNPSTGESVGEPLFSHFEHVDAVAVGRVRGRDAIASGGSKGIRIWTSAANAQWMRPHNIECGTVSAIALGNIGNQEVIVAGRGEPDFTLSNSQDYRVGVWNAVTRVPIFDPMNGHVAAITSIALGRIGNDEVIVSGSRDGTLRLWNAATGWSMGEPLRGHSDWVNAVVLGHIGGAEVIVSGGKDGTLRVWNAATRSPSGDPLAGHVGAVNAVLLEHVGDRDVIISGGADRTVRIWDATKRRTDVVLDLLVPPVAVGISRGCGTPVLCVATGRAVCTFLWSR
jgi:WD40 repeat protein